MPAIGMLQATCVLKHYMEAMNVSAILSNDYIKKAARDLLLNLSLQRGLMSKSLAFV